MSALYVQYYTVLVGQVTNCFFRCVTNKNDFLSTYITEANTNWTFMYWQCINTISKDSYIYVC